MDRSRRTSSTGSPFWLAAFVSASVGALVGAGYAIGMAEGSAFVVWVATGAAIVGAFAAVCSFIVGVLAYRVLRPIGRLAVSRIAAAVGAMATTGIIVYVTLVTVKSVVTVETVIGAVLFTAVASAFAIRPLERSFFRKV